MLYVFMYMTLSKCDIVLFFQVVTIGETRLKVHDIFLYCFLQSHVNLLFSQKIKRINAIKAPAHKTSLCVLQKTYTGNIH